MSTILKSERNNIIKYTEAIIAYGLPILYFLISVAFYLKTYDSAQIKITLIQIGGTILIATWLVKLIEENSWSFFKNNLVIVLPLLAFLISGIISFFHSPFFWASINELIRRVIYIFFALIVIKEFDNESKFAVLFNWLLAAAYLSCIYGAIQFLDIKLFPPPPEPGLDPFIWRQAFGTRVFSTFGNPNFFGDFLIVMSPIVLAFSIKNRNFHIIVLWLIILFNTIYTYSKGAWLGFASGIVVFTILYIGFFVQTNKIKIRKTLLIILTVTMLFASYGIFKNLKQRTDSASFRIFTWLSTWEMIKTNPFWGTGIGTFYVTYPAWRRPQIFFIEGRHNTETDHPENEYLEVWYDEGIMGIGIFLWLLTLFIYMSLKNLHNFSRAGPITTKIDLKAYYQLGILTALAAQLIHNAVCVSLRFVSSGVFLWLLIGLIGALNKHHPLPNTAISKENYKPFPVYLKRFFQIIVIIISVYLIKIFYGFFMADIYHNRAIFHSKQAQWTPALEFYDKVNKLNPSFIMAHYFKGNVFNDRWGEGDAFRAIDKYKDVWKLAPNYVQSHHQAGLIYLKWGEDEKNKALQSQKNGDLAAAKEHENKVLELWNNALSEFKKYRMIDPIFPLNYYRIAWIYMQLGNDKKAEEIYLDHINYPDNLKKPPHNAWYENWAKRRLREYSETYINLGNMFYMKNDKARAKEYYEKSYELDQRSVYALKNLAVIYGQTGEMQKASELWYKLRKLAPNDPDVKKVFSQPAK